MLTRDLAPHMKDDRQDIHQCSSCLVFLHFSILCTRVYHLTFTVYKYTCGINSLYYCARLTGWLV